MSRPLRIFYHWFLCLVSLEPGPTGFFSTCCLYLLNNLSVLDLASCSIMEVPQSHNFFFLFLNPLLHPQCLVPGILQAFNTDIKNKETDPSSYFKSSEGRNKEWNLYTDKDFLLCWPRVHLHKLQAAQMLQVTGIPTDNHRVNIGPLSSGNYFSVFLFVFPHLSNL